MTTQSLYNRAKNNGCDFENTCVGTTQDEWADFMKGSTRANKILATKIALLAGVIDEEQAKQEIRRSHFNPYNHFKTKTHLIYVHSCIEHFIKIY